MLIIPRAILGTTILNKIVAKYLTPYSKIIPHAPMTMLKHEFAPPRHLSTPNIEGRGRFTDLEKVLILLTQIGAFHNLSNYENKAF